jgi:hypothetical protein
LSISGAPDTSVTIRFGIFTESSMLNNLQSIAQEHRCQLLDPPESDSVQYISNYPQIGRQSKRYQVDVSDPETQLRYFWLPRRIQMTVSSIRNEVQAHIKSTLLSRLIVSDDTPQAYSIHRPIWPTRYSLLIDDPTPGYDPTPCMLLNSVYALCITLE